MINDKNSPTPLGGEMITSSNQKQISHYIQPQNDLEIPSIPFERSFFDDVSLDSKCNYIHFQYLSASEKKHRKAFNLSTL